MTAATPQDYGAKGDGVTDDSAAVGQWFAQIKARKLKGELAGRYRMARSAQWDLTSVADTGITVTGRGLRQDGFAFDPGATFSIVSSGGAFYSNFLDFYVEGSTTDAMLRVGRDDLSDAFNSCRLRLCVNNGNTDVRSAVATRLNQVMQSEIDIVSNAGGSGNPAFASAPGYGTAIQMRQVQFCRGSLAGGNARTGLHITSGYTFGNMFASLDLEEVDTGLLIDTPDATKNAFYGTIVAKTVYDCRAGSANRVSAVEGVYPGGTLSAATAGLIRH